MSKISGHEVFPSVVTDVPEPALVLRPDVPPDEHGNIPGVSTPPSIVERLYFLPQTGTENIPSQIEDITSHIRMGLYLHDRQDPKTPASRSTVVWGETGHTIPWISRVPAGTRTLRVPALGEGWWLPPKVAVAAMLGILAASVAAPAAGDLGDELRGVAHTVGQALNPPRSTTKTIAVTTEHPGPVVDVDISLPTTNAAGRTDVDPAAVGEFVEKVGGLIAEGGEVLDVTVTGRSSDEYPVGRDNTIGTPDSAQVDLSDDRATKYADAVGDALGVAGINAPLSDAEWIEYVLTPEQKQQVSDLALAEGFRDIYAAVVAIERGTAASPELTRLVDSLFTSKRGVDLLAQVQMPGETETETTYVDVEIPPEIPPAPENPDRDYNPVLIPILPIPRMRLRDKVVNRFRWAKRPGHPILKPTIVTEDEDHAWLRTRPEALREDGTLDPDAVLMTRKLEFYLREGSERFPATLRADYIAEDGEPGSIHLNFMDQLPSDSVVQAFGRVLQKAIVGKGGKIKDQIRHISVFLTPNAGTEHGDPRRIGLGIDRQEERNVLGQYTPLLRYAELHMPETFDLPEQELQEMFDDFSGPLWTIEHEVNGHAKDTIGNQLTLRSVRARGIPNAYIIEGNPWANRIGRWHNALRSIISRENPVLFDITYPVLDKEGGFATIAARVSSNDPRLEHATTAHVVGRRPTRYSDSNELEHWGELAAGASGIPIPFTQAGVRVGAIRRDDGVTAKFATGYHPDRDQLEAYRESVGALPGSFPVDFDPEKLGQVKLTLCAPEDDPLYSRHMRRARESRILHPDEMIAVLTQVTRRAR